MNKTKILWFPVFMLFFACTPEEENCDNRFIAPLNETDLEWFAFETGDTLIFYDAGSESQYHLACRSSIQFIDTVYTANRRCDDGGYAEFTPTLKSEFSSNIPHFEDRNLYAILTIRKPNDFIPIFDLKLYYGVNLYGYYLGFDSGTEAFKQLTPINSVPTNKGTVTINNIEYDDVYAICFSADPERSMQYAFYDTIYYNRDGFLKFISSQYGYVLERMP